LFLLDISPQSVSEKRRWRDNFSGRYDIDMFPTFLRLRGKTYDYKILYSSITRLFLLSPDDLHVEMVVSFFVLCFSAWSFAPYNLI
jgi:hypothetical protein